MGKGKVIAVCGRICSGKTYYGKELLKAGNTVLLSVDEAFVDIFNKDVGEKHDEIAERVKTYLHRKALDIVAAGCDVILDWGFWTENDRRNTSEFYRKRDVECLWHYIDIGDDDWQANIAQRNSAVLAGEAEDYYVDEGLLKKLESRFEEPCREEMDIWYHFERK